MNTDSTDLNRIPFNYNNCITLPYIGSANIKIKREFSKHGIKTIEKPLNNINNWLTKKKDRTKDEFKKNVIYNIKCKDCDAIYIGQSERNLGERIKEHRRAYDKKDSKKSAFVDPEKHDPSHNVDFENVKIMDIEPDKRKRLIKEGFYIVKNGKTIINRKNEVNEISMALRFL